MGGAAQSGPGFFGGLVDEVDYMDHMDCMDAVDGGRAGSLFGYAVFIPASRCSLLASLPIAPRFSLPFPLRRAKLA